MCEAEILLALLFPVQLFGELERLVPGHAVLRIRDAEFIEYAFVVIHHLCQDADWQRIQFAAARFPQAFEHLRLDGANGSA
jgi:hypothetical protein